MNLKKYLPFENYTLITGLTPEMLQERFNTYVEPKKEYRFLLFNKMPKNIYEGEMQDNSFYMNRVLRATSYKVLIWGHISSLNQQTVIKIRMQYELHIIVLSVIGLICMSLFCIVLLIIGIQNGFVLASLAAPGILLLGYLFGILVPFKDESSDAKKFLRKLFEAKETKV